jgi:multidrug resistance protein
MDLQEFDGKSKLEPKSGDSNSQSTTVRSSHTENKELPLPRHSTSSKDSISSPSHQSNHSDPLSPLEHALTPDLRIESEQMHQAHLTQTATSIGTTGSRIPSFEVDFSENDPENPRNWPLWYRGLIIGIMSFSTLTVVLYSTSYTACISGMMEEFNEPNESIVTLGVTTYLFGLACGSLILAPFSEIFGRRPIYAGAMGVFMILILPCAVAQSLYSIIIVRFFGAMAGAAMISNAPGTVSDISSDNYRALAFSVWAIGPMNGPVVGPVVGGFVFEYLGWRWTNWVVMIIAVFAWIAASSIKETYAPAILKKRAARMRKEMDDERYWSRYDDKLSPIGILKVSLSRPFVLTFTEPILWFWDFYVSVIYGILYLCFVAYPIIFTEDRGWSPGLSGLAFMGIGVGTMIAIALEPLFRRWINGHAPDPETGKVPPEASVGVICIAAVAAPVGQLIFAWTSTPIRIHWIWSILAGIPFGFGNTCIFIYASNYIAGSYGIYAASALAGNSVTRSIFGGTLPLAGPAMYKAMNPRWAGMFLGLLEVVLIPIPFIFYKWGDRIRRRSPLIRRMRADQERNDKRVARAVRREMRAKERDAEKQDAEKGDTEMGDIPIVVDEPVPIKE